MTEHDRKRIADTVAAVEARTSAHFSLVVVPAADRYVLFPVFWAALLGLSVGGVLALGWPDLDLRESFVIQAASFVAACLIFDWWPLRVALVPKAFKHTRARNLAHREFASHVMGHMNAPGHHHQNGVMFFVSLAERYVEVMAERDLHALAGEAAWQEMVARFVAAVRAGKIADGVVAGVTACGDILAAHAPKP